MRTTKPKPRTFYGAMAKKHGSVNINASALAARQRVSTSSLRCVSPSRMRAFLLDLGFCSQAFVGRNLFPGPVPDGVGISLGCKPVRLPTSDASQEWLDSCESLCGPFSSVGWTITQITTRGPGWFSLAAVKRRWRSRHCCFQLFPWLHLWMPTLQTNSRVVAGLLSPPWTGGVHQRWLSQPGQHRPESGLLPRRRFWCLLSDLGTGY